MPLQSCASSITVRVLKSVFFVVLLVAGLAATAMPSAAQCLASEIRYGIVDLGTLGGTFSAWCLRQPGGGSVREEAHDSAGRLAPRRGR